MTIASGITRVRAPIRARRLQRARRRRVVLSSGLAVYGTVTRLETRYENFIRDYFRPEFEIHAGMTVLDVGAHIGMFSLEVLRRCGGDARVLAFEPALDTFAYLERNLRGAFPHARARAYCCALGDVPGEATLYYRPWSAAESSLYSAPQTTRGSLLTGAARTPSADYRAAVPTWFRHVPPGMAKPMLRLGAWLGESEVVLVPCTVTTVSDVLREHEITCVDYLKIDVEGAELDVLRGVALEDWASIQRLGIEVHDVDGRLAQVGELLEAAGFDHVQIEQDWPFEGTNVYMVHAGRAAREPDPMAVT